jgi:hypothetical protein
LEQLSKRAFVDTNTFSYICGTVFIHINLKSGSLKVKKSGGKEPKV